MEMAPVGLRTRARAALAVGAASSAAPTPKRRKIDDSNQELRFSASSFVQLKSRSSHAVDVIPETTPERCSSPTFDEFPESCCSSNGSIGLDDERIKSLDLEVENAQVETSSTCKCVAERREMSLSSEHRTNSQDLESVEKETEANSRCGNISTLHKMPTELELQEFFAAAEKDIEKGFIDKYNYDFGKDVPLKGRYEWVQSKPEKCPSYLLSPAASSSQPSQTLKKEERHDRIEHATC